MKVALAECWWIQKHGRRNRLEASQGLKESLLKTSFHRASHKIPLCDDLHSSPHIQGCKVILDSWPSHKTLRVIDTSFPLLAFRMAQRQTKCHTHANAVRKRPLHRLPTVLSLYLHITGTQMSLTRLQPVITRQWGVGEGGANQFHGQLHTLRDLFLSLWLHVCVFFFFI